VSQQQSAFEQTPPTHRPYQRSRPPLVHVTRAPRRQGHTYRAQNRPPHSVAVADVTDA